MQRASRGIFPLDERLGLSGSGLSPSLQHDVVWLSSLLPYAQASEVLERIGRQRVSKTTIWEQTQRVGTAWVEREQQGHVSVQRTRWEQRDYQPFLRKSVGMDGGMVNIRQEGWKELKVGVVGTLTPPWELDEGQAARSDDLRYTACLGSADDFAPHLWRLAVQQQVPYAGHVAVTADGASWIWRLSADLFPQSTQIVDWYHAAQQAATLAQTRFPSDPLAAQRWHGTLKRYLWQGEVWKLSAQAQAHGLSPGYFISHQHRLDYPDYRAAGYPVGSGTTESGVKQYKQRLCGPGMRWNRANLNRMLVLRSAAMDGSFGQRWVAA